MAATVLVAALLAVGAFLALYYAIERETADPEITDRRTAQREAMAQGGRSPGSSSDRKGAGRDDRSDGPDGRTGRERR